MNRNRREFLEDVGSGMLIVGLGATLAGDLGISPALADEGSDSLWFGKLQPLVGLMQETPVEKLQPILVKKLKDQDTSIRQLVAAAALANAETFGGEDYVGFHTEMALLPAYQMAMELPAGRRPLPVLKVLYRNTHRIQESGLARNKVLKTVSPTGLPSGASGGELLRHATRAADMQQAERIFAAQVGRSVDDAYNHLLWSVQDDTDVHRFVLAHRSLGLIDIVGQENAHTMLRQCVRYCVSVERGWKKRGNEPPIRRLIPKLIDQYKLLGRRLGTRQPEDSWLDEMAGIIHDRDREQATDAVAAALAEGFAPEAVGQAIALAANQLVLRQETHEGIGRRTHGDAPGVHSSDAANAWRNMVRVANHRNTVVGLLVSANLTRRFRTERLTESAPYPHASHREEVKTTDAKRLLQIAEAAIRENDQGRAAAAIQIYGEQGHGPRPVFELMLRYGISEDGRLHAEKYYRTVSEEFATTRPAFRWRQLVALARVTASAYSYNRKDESGHRAPGYEEACRLLEVQA